MTTFFFDIDVVPTSAAAKAADVASASAITFVIADAPDVAETLARSAIMDYGWEIKGISLSRQPTDEQIAGLDDDIYAVYEKARFLGVGFLLVAHPKVEGNPDDPVQVRSLGSPIIDATKSH